LHQIATGHSEQGLAAMETYLAKPIPYRYASKPPSSTSNCCWQPVAARMCES
jgi:hypothetical protein